eukprot:4054220-Pleurochrysis_carterae.AAC.1
MCARPAAKAARVIARANTAHPAVVLFGCARSGAGMRSNRVMVVQRRGESLWRVSIACARKHCPCCRLCGC